jgi:hypothetical protein
MASYEDYRRRGYNDNQARALAGGGTVWKSAGKALCGDTCGELATAAYDTIMDGIAELTGSAEDAENRLKGEKIARNYEGAKAFADVANSELGALRRNTVLTVMSGAEALGVPLSEKRALALLDAEPALKPWNCRVNSKTKVKECVYPVLSEYMGFSTNMNDFLDDGLMTRIQREVAAEFSEWVTRYALAAEAVLKSLALTSVRTKSLAQRIARERGWDIAGALAALVQEQDSGRAWPIAGSSPEDTYEFRMQSKAGRELDAAEREYIYRALFVANPGLVTAPQGAVSSPALKDASYAPRGLGLEALNARRGGSGKVVAIVGIAAGLAYVLSRR